MLSSLDLLVVALYLVFMLLIGFYTAKKPIRNMRDYALGSGGLGSYSFLALVGTLVATNFGAGSTLGDSGKIFQLGLGWILFKLMAPVMYLIFSESIAPRMGRFLESGLHDNEAFLSVGDMMRSFYGPGAQVLCGFSGLLMSIGVLGAQVSGTGWLLHYCFGWDYSIGVALGFGVVVAYTTAGGIRSVVATDIWQLGVIIIALPVITHLALKRFLGGNSWAIGDVRIWSHFWQSIPESHKTLIPIGMHALDYVMLLIVGATPFFQPTIMQRMLMAQDTHTLKTMFRIGAFLQVLFCSMVLCAGFAGCLLFPEAEPMSVLLRVVQSEAQPVLLGICIVGILAAIMSTADSLLNVASICLSHDICKTLLQSKLSAKGELQLARWSTVGIGIFAALIAVRFTSIRDLIIAAETMWGWAQMIVVPVWAGILGYRASGRVFWIAVLAGQLAYWGFPYLLPAGVKLSATLPALLANGLAFWAARKWEQGQKPKTSPRQDPPTAKVTEGRTTSVTA